MTRGKRLSPIEIAAMEQDWITSPVQPKRKEFGQKHGVAPSTVQKYYEQGDWKIKRLAHWDNLGQVVTEVSKVSLAQASKSNGTSITQQQEAVEQSVEVVGRFIAGAVNQREDQTTKALKWINDVLLQVFQGITTENDHPLIITAGTPDEVKKQVRKMLGAISFIDRVKILPALVKSIADVTRIQEVMQGRPDTRLEIVGTPQNLSPDEEAALEVVHRIAMREA